MRFLRPAVTVLGLIAAVIPVHGESLGDWGAMPLAIRSSIAVDAAQKIHDGRFTVSRQGLALHIRECLDAAVASSPPDLEVVIAIRKCAASVMTPH